MDISQEAGLRAEVNRRLKAIATSRGESSMNGGVETIIRQVLIPANSWRQGEQFNIKGGGFAIAQGGGNLTSFRLIGRVGSAGLSSGSFFDTTFVPNSNVAFWWYDWLISHDVSSPDFVGIGGIGYVSGATKDYNLTRGELVINFSIDNLIIVSGLVTGAGSPNTIVSETFQITKTPNQEF